MLVTRNVELAIDVIGFLKKQTKVVKIEDMVSEVGGSINFLEQILRKLRVYGLVRSVRGPGGGYAITEAGQTTTVYAVNEALRRTLKLPVSYSEANMKLHDAIQEAFLRTYV